jgi:membrane associated rhomboid family serine protease
MGIYDREYYRGEGTGLFGSFASRGAVCKWLIGLNVVCFLVQMLTLRRDPNFGVITSFGPFTETLELNVPAVLHGEVWRLLTYAFLHSVLAPLHIVFNMLFLWWFGSDLEDHYGPREFLCIYLVAALLGGAAFVLSAVTGLTRGTLCLGASGAVTAILVLAALHYPRRIILLFFVLPVPLWAFVVFMVVTDAFQLLGKTETGVAVQVHLAGAAFAFAYYQLHWRLTGLFPNFRGWMRRRSQPRLRVYREEQETPTPVSVPSGGASAAVPDEEQLEAKMDAILEKISRSGKESLTEKEHQILLKASEILKRRRR